VIYEAEAGKISIALAGDIILNRPLQRYREPGFLAMVDFVRSADVAFANLENLYHDWTVSYESDIPAYLVGQPGLIDDIRWLGFSAVSLAMNHAMDSGQSGLLETMRHCADRGLPFAGAGLSLASARAPVYVDHPAGRVALLGACTTFYLPEHAAAGPAAGEFPGKPGINVFHHDTTYTVPRDIFDALKATQDAFELVPSGSPDQIRLFGRTIRRGDGFHESTSCSRGDVEQLARSVSAAKKLADFVVCSVHCHESGSGDRVYNATHRISPPEFLIDAAHAAIDAGCDAFFSHGPHILRAVEIYKGRPVLYGLGNFSFQLETPYRVPPAAFARVGLPIDGLPGEWAEVFSEGGGYAFAAERACYQSVIGRCDFDGGKLARVALCPIEMGFGLPMSQRGRPVMAQAAARDEIFEFVRAASRSFGTSLDWKGGLIHVNLG
jgi:poly-gamma-glutamate synthesis protein (capsule biosynthesis protein)